jgi:hypothetical protein
MQQSLDGIDPMAQDLIFANGNNCSIACKISSKLTLLNVLDSARKSNGRTGIPSLDTIPFLSPSICRNGVPLRTTFGNCIREMSAVRSCVEGIPRRPGMSGLSETVEPAPSKMVSLGFMTDLRIQAIRCKS